MKFSEIALVSRTHRSATRVTEIWSPVSVDALEDDDAPARRVLDDAAG